MKSRFLIVLASLAVPALIFLVLPSSPKATEPRNQDLHATLTEITKIVVRTGGTCHRQTGEEQVLAAETDPGKIQELISALQIDDAGTGFECGCCGNPTFEFYSGRRLKVTLGYHHGISVRWDQWTSDALLTTNSVEAVLSWLDQRGITGPREERTAARARWDLNIVPPNSQPRDPAIVGSADPEPDPKPPQQLPQ